MHRTREAKQAKRDPVKRLVAVQNLIEMLQKANQRVKVHTSKAELEVAISEYDQRRDVQEREIR